MTEKKVFAVSQLRCPNCNNSLNLSSPKIQGIACSTCGSIFDPNSPEATLARSLKPSDHPPRSFIKLGLLAKFEEKSYQVIGRISYLSRMQEWDDEDSCYLSETWQFDEWILVGGNKEYLYLQEDEEGYAIAKTFVPVNPSVPPAGTKWLNLHSNGGSYRIEEYGEAEAQYFEGEFTWLPEVGERVKYAEYEAGGVTYCVEYRLNETNEPEEIEFFEARPIAKLDLLLAFNLTEELKRYHEEKALALQYAKWAGVFLAASAVLFVLGFCSYGVSGTKVFEKSVALSDLDDDDGYLVGPIPLLKKGAVYALTLSATLPDNSDAWVAVELISPDDQLINMVEGDFWRESGVDSEGSWSESDTTTDYNFRLDNPGQYYARLVSELPAGAQSGSAYLSVYEGIVLGRYYLIAAVISLGYAYGIKKRNSLHPIWVMGGLLMLIGFLSVKFIEHAGDD